QNLKTLANYIWPPCPRHVVEAPLSPSARPKGKARGLSEIYPLPFGPITARPPRAANEAASVRPISLSRESMRPLSSSGTEARRINRSLRLVPKRARLGRLQAATTPHHRTGRTRF